MKLPTITILAVLLAVSAAQTPESRGFLDYDILLVEEPTPYPFSYCLDNLPLSVESLEVSAPPAKGHHTKMTIVHYHRIH